MEVKSTLSLPVDQAGFSHSQITHNDDLGDFKSDGEKRSNRFKNTFFSFKRVISINVQVSPHSAGSLLLAGCPHFTAEILLNVDSRLFPKRLKRAGGQRTVNSCCPWVKMSDWAFITLTQGQQEVEFFFLVSEPEPDDRFYLWELSDDSVPSNRRENTPG